MLRRPVESTQYLLSKIHNYRYECLAQGYFEPSQAISASESNTVALEQWVNRLEAQASNIDPITYWRPLVKYFRYSKRQKLKYEALLAQDFYETTELLKLFINDLELETDRDDLVRNRLEIMPHNRTSNASRWERERYGESLSRPYEMLEFLSNEYDLNPKPRAVVLTEGEEWKAIAKLYTYCGYVPELLGIEFRSISGHGNFSLANWQCFIEYMHEKQTLVYFLLDNEGRSSKEAKRLLNKKRLFSFSGLEKVIPSRDRIRVWSHSFEESNFSNAEIKRALSCQGVEVSSQQVADIRIGEEKKGWLRYFWMRQEPL